MRAAGLDGVIEQVMRDVPAPAAPPPVDRVSEITRICALAGVADLAPQ